ncbi:MAG TPA: hypothetical protein VGJ44_10555 [Kribbellaceae bacterium]
MLIHSGQVYFGHATVESAGQVAVECGGERLTYRGLNERANQFAHHLRALGDDAVKDLLAGIERRPTRPDRAAPAGPARTPGPRAAGGRRVDEPPARPGAVAAGGGQPSVARSVSVRRL